MTPSGLYVLLMKRKRDTPLRVRSWTAIDSFLNRKSGAHGGSKRDKNKRIRADRSYKEDR